MTFCDLISHSLKPKCYLLLPFLLIFFSAVLDFFHCLNTSPSLLHPGLCIYSSFLSGIQSCHPLHSLEDSTLSSFFVFACFCFYSNRLLFFFFFLVLGYFPGVRAFLWIHFFLFVAFITIVNFLQPLFPCSTLMMGNTSVLFRVMFPNAHHVEDTQ